MQCQVEEGDVMKNKKLALLLAAASLHSNLSAKEYNSDISNEVTTEKYINQQDKEMLDISKEKMNKHKNIGFMRKAMRVGGKILKLGLTGVGVISTVQASNNHHNARAKKEYLSLIDKYKALPYNKRFDKFLETAESLIAKYEKSNKDSEKETDEEYKVDKRTNGYLMDLLLFGKSKDDMNNVSFGRLKDSKQLVCADFTYILQSLAQELGLICYNLLMFSSKGGNGHSILMIAQKRENPDVEKKFNWFIIDGVNYSYIRKLIEARNPKKSKQYPKFNIANMIRFYKSLSAFGYDKMYIVKNNNCIFIKEYDAKNEMVAVLNDKLIDSLNNGYDVNWTDDSYVKCFEQIEKDKS